MQLISRHYGGTSHQQCESCQLYIFRTLLTKMKTTLMVHEVRLLPSAGRAEESTGPVSEVRAFPVSLLCPIE